LGVFGAVESGETMLDCPFTFCPYIKVGFTPEGVRSMHDIIRFCHEKAAAKEQTLQQFNSSYINIFSGLTFTELFEISE